MEVQPNARSVTHTTCFSCI